MTKERFFSIAIIGLFLLSLFVTFAKKSPVHSESDEGFSGAALFNEKGIAVVSISGPIQFSQSSSSSFFPDSADLILKQLLEVEKNENVKGLLLKINSPGGTVGSSQEILAALRRIKEKRKIPIVAQIGDMGASGAYYVCLGADKVFANRGSMVGSIGVIMSGIQIKELADNIGIKDKTYKSGAYKDTMSMWRESSPEEDVMIQEMIDSVYEQFLADVILARKLEESKARALAQGQVFTGERAVKEGLIDAIGTYHDALRYLGEKTGLGEYPPIISIQKVNWMDFATIWTSQLTSSLFASKSLSLR